MSFLGYWGIPKRSKTTDANMHFYQDAELKCYLFSVSDGELFDLEYEKYKFPKFRRNDVLLIERDGVRRATTKEEYERIEPTLNPHPYDSSLCKPKPVQETMDKRYNTQEKAEK